MKWPPLVPGLQYWVTLADDPEAYRAMLLVQPREHDRMLPCWYIFDHGGGGHKLTADRHVRVVGLDFTHLAVTLQRAAALAAGLVENIPR